MIRSFISLLGRGFQSGIPALGALLAGVFALMGIILRGGLGLAGVSPRFTALVVGAAGLYWALVSIPGFGDTVAQIIAIAIVGYVLVWRAIRPKKKRG